MKSSVNVAQTQPTVTVNGLNVGQGLQLPNKNVIVRLASAVYLLVESNSGVGVFSMPSALDQSPGLLLPPGSSVSITL